MSQPPFRFVHAANVRLDQPIWGIGELTAEARRLAEEATNLAFEQVVETTIASDADLLLLVGNTFDAAAGYRPRLLLEQACERLAEHDCQVVILPGASDPPHVWDTLPLPPMATVLDGTQNQSVDIVRDGALLATVEAFVDRQSTPAAGSKARVRIGLAGGTHADELLEVLRGNAGRSLEIEHLSRFPSLVDFGYLALGGGSEAINVPLPRGLANDPGCPQPLDGRNTTSLGCALVEVDGAGQIHSHTIPTATVRREQIDLRVTGESDWDSLVAQMRSALGGRTPLESERLWLICWTITGEGGVLGDLQDTSAQQDLAELIEEELERHDELLRIHEFDVHTPWSDAVDVARAGSVFEEFIEVTSVLLADQLGRFQRGLAGRDWPEANWVSHVIGAGEQLTKDEVARCCQSLARQQLLTDDRDVA